MRVNKADFTAAKEQVLYRKNENTVGFRSDTRHSAHTDCLRNLYSPKDCTSKTFLWQRREQRPRCRMPHPPSVRLESSHGLLHGKCETSGSLMLLDVTMKYIRCIAMSGFGGSELRRVNGQALLYLLPSFNFPSTAVLPPVNIRSNTTQIGFLKVKDLSLGVLDSVYGIQ
jgi:hypothetical protein